MKERKTTINTEKQKKTKNSIKNSDKEPKNKQKNATEELKRIR